MEIAEYTLADIDLGETISLPVPFATGPFSLEEALARRRSCREFERRRLPLEVIGQILWAAQGVSDASGLRTAPSAGARYPLRLRLYCAEGVFLYFPEGHRLRKICGQDLRGEIAQASYGQEFVEVCGAAILFTALYERTTARYGDRGRRYVLIDLGHAAQNALLQAVTLGVDAVPVAAFDDDLLARICELPPEETPLYLVPIGYARREA